MSRFTSTTELGRRSLRRPPLRLVAALLVAGAVGLAVQGCSSRQPPPPVVLNCEAADAPYDFRILENYDVANGYGWFGFGDLTPGASWLGQDAGAPPLVQIENGGPCGTTTLPSEPSQGALFLESSGFQDYGNDWGTYAIGGFGVTIPGYTSPQFPCVLPDGGDPLPDAAAGLCSFDASAYDGLTFWARSYDPTGAPTTKGFTLMINDKKSTPGVDLLAMAIAYDGDAACVPYDAGFLANGAVSYAPTGGSTGPAGGGTVSAVPPANACGNSFAYPLLTTGEWQLYTIPWSSFNQLARPNRITTGFDPSSFFSILIAAPKEAHAALWIDDLGFYRAKQREAGQ
jgi:hypothetical protein